MNTQQDAQTHGHNHHGEEQHTAQAGHSEHAEHAGQDEHAGHGGHGGHSGHGDHVAQFRRLFWINLVIAVPVVGFSSMFAMLLGYEIPGFPGAALIAPILGTVMYIWGGRPFLMGAVSELRARKPGMMLLIALAITVAFAASWGASLGLLHHDLEFWWELALLIVIMLLGHWIEMRSLAQTTSALDSLAALLPDSAERVEGDRIVQVSLLSWPSGTSSSFALAGACRLTAGSRRAGPRSTRRWSRANRAQCPAASATRSRPARSRPTRACASR